MAELLALTVFWMFLYITANGMLIFGWKDKLILPMVIGLVLSLVLAFYSMNISYTSIATNWVMIGLCFMSIIAGVGMVLASLPDMFKF